MESLTLAVMTPELCHALYKEWENDEATYMDMSLFKPFSYNAEAVHRYFESRQEPSRILFAIMLGDKPIGELQLKSIDRVRKECTLSIHLQNDAVKNKGYGTQAEHLAVQYAFHELGMAAVNADATIKNTRSQHVLEKVGFVLTREEGIFRYYRMENPKGHSIDEKS